MCPEWPWNAGYDAPNLACVPGNAAHMSWLVPRSSFANFFSDSWRIFGYDKIFCAHMHTADATDCLQNQHSHLIDSLCTLLSAAKSPTNTIAARTMIFGHSGLSILRCGCGYFISPPCMHMQIRGTVGSLRSCKPCCIRAANAKEETTGRTGALGFLICVLSPIDDFGEKNIMRLFVLFLD